MPEIVELDVRPVLRAGGEPLTQIMEAVKNLAPGQDLRLFSPFMPGPLLQMLGAQGFRHEVKELAGGEWQVDFTASTGTDGEQAGADDAGGKQCERQVAGQRPQSRGSIG